jgi:hypothetical protein
LYPLRKEDAKIPCTTTRSQAHIHGTKKSDGQWSSILRYTLPLVLKRNKQSFETFDRAMKYGYLLLLTMLFSCKKDDVDHPDIQTGLVVNLPLDGTAYDSISAATGAVHSAVPATDRHGEIGKAILFTRTDSSFIDFGDLSGASFPSNQFTISCG